MKMIDRSHLISSHPWMTDSIRIPILVLLVAGMECFLFPLDRHPNAIRFGFGATLNLHWKQVLQPVVAARFKITDYKDENVTAVGGSHD